MKLHLAAGGEVQVAIITSATLWVAECSEPLDLQRRGIRLLLEEQLRSEARDGVDSVDNIRLD
jgi:hypothetical protein